MASDGSVQTHRDLKGIYGLVGEGICLLLASCAFYWVLFGVTHIIYQRATYLMLTCILCFLYFPFWERSPKHRFTVPDVILSLLMIGITLYVVVGYTERVERLGIITTNDTIFGSLSILMGIEMVRRVLGKLLAVLSGAFILYAYLGPYLPGPLAHRGFSVGRIVSHVFSGMEGIYGLATGVMCTFVLMFIIFGAFLERSGISQFFIDLSFGLTRRGKGGPAKAAVVASGFMGSISGSAIANVLTTGIFTIPMMKKVGYKPHVAGAIEAAASTGGQIMPPLMGAAVFVMVGFTGVSYLEIIKVATVPAVLYFFLVLLFVHLEALKQDITVSRELLGAEYDLGSILRKGWFYVLPIIFLVIVLMRGHSPMTSGFYALIATVAVSMVRKETRMGPVVIVRTMILGARYSMVVGSIAAAIGIIIGIVGLTGIGLRFSEFIVSMSGGSLIVAVFFVILASLILGMGLPTTPAYIIVAIFAGPSLSRLGIGLLPAHLLMIWYSIDSSISPPVALTAYTASGIARSNPIRTMFTAFKYAKGLYILPYLFVYRPPLLLQGSFGEIVVTVVYVAAGLMCSVFCVEGFVSKRITVSERTLYGCAALALFYNQSTWNVLGLGVTTGLIIFHFLRSRKARTQNHEVHNIPQSVDEQGE